MQVKKPKPQHIPLLFQQIMANDKQRRLIKASPIVDMSNFRRLRDEHAMQMRHAEKIYAGTKNNGKEI